MICGSPCHLEQILWQAAERQQIIPSILRWAKDSLQAASWQTLSMKLGSLRHATRTLEHNTTVFHLMLAQIVHCLSNSVAGKVGHVASHDGHTLVPATKGAAHGMKHAGTQVGFFQLG
jgi:hypothetical protein